MSQVEIFGYVIIALLSLLGLFLSAIVFFVSKVFGKIDKNSDVLTEVCSDLRLIKEGLTGVKEKTDKLSEEFLEQISVLKDEIEMLRSSRHKILNYITALRTYIEIKARLAGESPPFKDLWDIPTMADFNRDRGPK